MANMSGIASMLAQSGANIGQQIGAPISAFGQGLGGMLTARKEKQREEAAAQEAQALLQQYANNPAQLNALGQKYATEGNDALSKLFLDAAQKAVATQGREAMGTGISAIGSQDPQAMLEAAASLAKIPGMEQQALALAKAANEAKNKQAEEVKMQARRDSLSRRASDLGLTGLSETIMETSDASLLKDIAKDIRAQELKGVSTKSTAVRRRIAQTSGIDVKTFDKLDLANVSDAEFDAIILGEKGDVKSWMTTDGKIVALRVNESALVYDEADQKWKQPGEMGLTQAPPQVQKVEQIASEMGTELAKVGAKNFTELQDKAVKAADTIRSIDESLPMVDDMFTGALANVKLNVNRYAKAFGVDLGGLEGITNTETYAAMAATRVADYITNLGAGTGLSDKDLEFARQVVAGDVKADASSLKRILNSLRDGAVNKINQYNKVREDIRSGLGEGQSGVLTFFPAVQVPEGGVMTYNWGEL